MALRITIDIFSGRENPVIELTGREALEAMERLKPTRRIKRGEIGLPPSPTLGYRGLIIEQTKEPVKDLPKVFRFAHGSMFGPRLAHIAADEAFEDFICGSTGPIKKLGLGEKFPALVEKEIKRFKEVRAIWPWEGKIIWPLKNPCQCAPLYEPDWWNDGGQKQLHNNCYNYASNYRTDTFHVIAGGGQPGAAAGAMYTSLACASVKTAAIADGLIDSPNADNKCPGEGHLVALVRYAWDFHWYRKGRNGYWSHKPGSTAVTNLDNGGTAISDPRTANRGPYTDFCTFMVVMHGHIKIK
jgi:hypothetical protein